MGPEDFPKDNGDARLSAEVVALTARVEALERQLARMQSPGQGAIQPAPAPPPALPAIVVPQQPATKPSIFHLSSLQQKGGASLENRLGSQIFGRIGIFALLIGVAWFLKLAIDNQWIGPIGRVLVGLIAGTGVIVWSESFRLKGFNAFSYSLKAIGSGVLYLSLWAAFQLYHLMPGGLALATMIMVMAWNAYMAWVQNSEVLAGYAITGGFLTPLLLSTGGNHEIFLFTYVLAIDLAAILLVRLKRWPRLLLATFPTTVAYFIGWYVSYNSADQITVTVIFVSLFFTAFLTVPLRDTPQSTREDVAIDTDGRSSRIGDILLPLANAVFVSLALYSLLEDAGYHELLPWVMVLLGALYLGVMRLPQPRVASAVHLSAAIVSLTVAIPLKASGRWITVGWLAEGVALLWVSARLSQTRDEKDSSGPHHVLRWLGVMSLTLGVCGLLSLRLWFFSNVDLAFINARFATSLFGVASLAAAAWIALHTSRQYEDVSSPRWMSIAGASIISLNFVAILACVRELETLWNHTSGNPEAELQRALAISAFLMTYGALLLAVGFRERSSFIRWQALILIVFTIAKTFIYDMRNLTMGYRAASFLGLGALLMTVSFAYQKDWLALREPQHEHNATLDQPTGSDS